MCRSTSVDLPDSKFCSKIRDTRFMSEERSQRRSGHDVAMIIGDHGR